MLSTVSKSCSSCQGHVYPDTKIDKFVRWQTRRLFCSFAAMKHALIANGRRIASVINGRSKNLPLILLHGFCEDHTVWDGLVPFFKGIRLIRVDLPGFGGSDAAAVPGMSSYADAVCAVLNDLNIERCVMVGHSMGGYTALAFAEKYPERLAGFGLFHSHSLADTEVQIENRRRGIEVLRSGKKAAYVAQLFPTLFPPEFAAAHPDILDRLIRRGRRQSTEGIIAALQGMIERPDRSEVLRQTVVPVLFLLGEKDQLVPPAHREKMMPLPRLADLHLLPGIGHMGMFEAPDKAAEIVGTFYSFCKKKVDEG